MTAKLQLNDEGIRVVFAASDKDAMSVAAPFLVAVMKASRDGRSFQVDADEAATAVAAILQFFTKRSFDVELDDGARRIIERIDAGRRDFTDARQKGRTRKTKGGSASIQTNLQRKLMPLQVEGAAHLVAVQNGANFSVPGAGKTTIAYAAFAKLREQGTVDKLLVLAPRAAFLPWEEEFAECFGRAPTSVRLTGGRQRRDQTYSRSEEFELFLCTYQTATNDLGRLKGLCRRHRVMLVLDESHYVKRLEDGQWAKAVLDLAPYATRRVILSGTPMPQGYEDLWTQFTFLWPGREILGEKFAFRRKVERGETADIKDSLRPFFRRTTKRDLRLPEMRILRIPTALRPEQQRIYHAIREKVLSELNLQPSDRHLLRRWKRARMVRLLQAASNPALLSEYSAEFAMDPEEASDRSVVEVAKRYADFEVPAKFTAARELVEQIASSGKKTVVWTSFVKNIEMFRALIGRALPTFIVFGAVPRDPSEDEEFNREQQIASFKEAHGPAVLIANPAACGESISLHHACTDAVYIDRTFDCAKYVQSQDRIHRLGLASDAVVTAYLLIANDTIDETIDHRLLEKIDRMAALFESDLPEGSPSDVDQDESEEAKDFDATVRDLRRSKKTKRD